MEEEYIITIRGSWGVMAHSEDEATEYILEQFRSGNVAYTGDVEQW